MNNSSVRQIILEEIRIEKPIRTILSSILIPLVLILMVIPSFVGQLLSIKAVFLGFVLLNFYYTLTFMYSKLKNNKRNALWVWLPVKKNELFIGYQIIIFINTFIRKVFPVTISVYTYLYFKKSIELSNLLIEFLCLTLSCAVANEIAFEIILQLLNKKYFSLIKNIAVVFLLGFFRFYDFSLLVLIPIFLLFFISAFFTFEKCFRYFPAKCKKVFLINRDCNLLKREVIRFFDEKLFIINHFGLSLLSLFFLYNLSNSQTQTSFVKILVMFLPLMSTVTSTLFSYEKENINFFKVLPISKNSILFAKYILTVIITLPVYLIELIRDFLTKGAEGEFYIYLIFSVLVILYAKLYLDYLIPYLKYDHIKQLLENKRKYLFWIITFIIYVPFFLWEFMNGIFIVGLQVIICGLIIICVRNLKMHFEWL